jgi:hypothetical protein
LSIQIKEADEVPPFEIRNRKRSVAETALSQYVSTACGSGRVMFDDDPPATAVGTDSLMQPTN